MSRSLSQISQTCLVTPQGLVRLPAVHRTRTTVTWDEQKRLHCARTCEKHITNNSLRSPLIKRKLTRVLPCQPSGRRVCLFQPSSSSVGAMLHGLDQRLGEYTTGFSIPPKPFTASRGHNPEASPNATAGASHDRGDVSVSAMGPHNSDQ